MLAFLPASLASYHRYSSGADCAANNALDPVDQASCEAAAAELGLRDSTAFSSSYAGTRPGMCSYSSNNFLNWQPHMAATVGCGDQDTAGYGGSPKPTYDCICYKNDPPTPSPPRSPVPLTAPPRALRHGVHGRELRHDVRPRGARLQLRG